MAELDERSDPVASKKLGFVCSCCSGNVKYVMCLSCGKKFPFGCDDRDEREIHVENERRFELKILEKRAEFLEGVLDEIKSKNVLLMRMNELILGNKTKGNDEDLEVNKSSWNWNICLYLEAEHVRHANLFIIVYFVQMNYVKT